MNTKRMLFIINPCAGQRRVARKLADILQRFCAGDMVPTVLTTEYAGHARKLVQQYAGQHDIVVCAGGDGTLNETVAGLLESGADIPIGYLPCGTTNDLASTLGLSRDLDQAAQDILDGQPRMLDIGSFNGRNFVYTASFGAFTSVSYATPQPIKNVLGHLAYLLEGVKNLGQLQPVYADVHTDSGDYSGDFLFGSVSNTTSLAGILTLDKSLVQLDDGRFELLLVDMPRNAIEFSQLLINVAQRKFEGLLHLSTASAIEINTRENVDWTLDGEDGRGGTHFDIRNLGGAVRIITNQPLVSEGEN